MSQDEFQAQELSEKANDLENNLEIIPESKKEELLDQLPLQTAEEIVLDSSQDPRVLAACELPLAVEALKPMPKSDPLPEELKLELGSAPSSPPKDLPSTPIIQSSDLVGAKVGPKSAKHSQQKKLTTKKESAKTQKAAQALKESLYDKVLKESKITSKKSVSKTFKQCPSSVCASESAIDLDKKAMFLQLRESLLALQKKDAITRQAVEKLQKEKRGLEEEKKRKEGLISKCEKARATDGSTIAKQEEIIAKLRINQQITIENAEKPLRKKLEEALAENAKLMELNALLRASHDNPVIEIEKLNRLVEKQDIKELSETMNQGCDSYEELVANYENCMKKIRGYVEDQHSELFKEKTRLKEASSLLKKERINDQKRLLDLQRRLGYAMEEYEQDKSKLIKGDTLMGVDLNFDENCMKSKVDDIMLALRDKIITSARENINDEETNKFINRISMTASQKGSVDSPKRTQESVQKLY